MRNFVRPAAAVALAAGGLVLWFIGNLTGPGVALIVMALIVSASGPGVIGRLGTDHDASSRVEAGAVKKFRSENPGATIADGVRATRT